MAALELQEQTLILPSHLIPSRPREAEAKTSEEGIGDRKQVQSFYNYISRGVVRPILLERRGITRGT
jgi:hypothetical protein